MQIRRSATAIAAVIFGSSTCFAGVDFCKEFSSLARTSASLSDATYMLNLLSERALQIAEQILSEQRLIPVEAVGALQQFARTYSELDSQRNSPVLMDEYSQSFIEALIANHRRLQAFEHTEPIVLLNKLTSSLNSHVEDPKQQLKNFLLVNLLVEDMKGLRSVAMTRAGAIYLLVRFTTLRETLVADKRFDLIAMHDMLKNLINRINPLR